MANYYDFYNSKNALDYAAKNFDSENDFEARDLSLEFAEKYNLTSRDLRNYRAGTGMSAAESNKYKTPALDKIYAKFEADYGLPSPINIGERFTIKNLIDEDPNLQIKYLNGKGYHARINKQTGELEAALPGRPFAQVDATGFEFADIIDVVGDGINTAVEGFVTGARILSGPLGFAATIPVGAATSAGLETLKQKAAMLAGARDDYDYYRVGEKALMGGVLPLIPKVLGTLPKSVEKWRYLPKDNIEKIKAAGRAMGAEPTEGMLSRNRDFQRLEDHRIKELPPTGHNIDLKDKVQKNIDATDEYAENIFKNRLSMSDVDAGRVIQEKVVSSLRAKKDRAKELYDSLGKNLDLPGYRINIGELHKTLDGLEAQFSKDEIGRKWVNSIREEIDTTTTIGQLRNLNRRFKNDVSRYELNDPPLGGAAKVMGKRGHQLIDDSFNELLDSLEKYAPENTLLAKESMDFVAQQRANLYEANKLYREVNEHADTILKRPGAETKGAASLKIDKIEGEDYAVTFNRILSNKDLKKAAWMKKNYPAEFEMAVNTKINEIFEKAETIRKGNNSQSLGSALSERIRKLSNTEKEVLFGKEGVEKANHLAVWFGNQGALSNPSGTGLALSLTQTAMTHWDQTLNALRYSWGTAAKKTPNKIISTIGKTIDNPATRGGFYLLPKREGEVEEKNLFIP